MALVSITLKCKPNIYAGRILICITKCSSSALQLIHIAGESPRQFKTHRLEKERKTSLPFIP